MTRAIRVAVRGTVADALTDALVTDHDVTLGEDGRPPDCVLAPAETLRTDTGRPVGTDADGAGPVPVVALCRTPAAQADAYAAGADRCVTLTGDATADATSVAAALAVGDDRPDDGDALLREAFDALADVFFVVDTDLQFLAWNDAVTTVTGYDDETLAAMEPLGLVGEEDVVDVRTALERAVDEGRATVAADLLTGDGERIAYEFTATALTAADGTVRGVCGVGRDVSERRRRERTLDRQAESLRTLNRINEVVRSVNRGLVRARDREGIERAVVERLADGRPYRFAWVGDHDPGAEEVVVRATAGDADPPLDVAEGETLVDDATALAAMREGTMLVDDPGECPARGGAEDGVAVGAAVPLVYRGVTYGVLRVYADDRAAVEGTERAVLAELGETVAHAIGAAERHRALVDDAVVELEVLVDDVDGDPSFGSLLADHGGVLRRVDVEEGSFRFVATFPRSTDVRRVLEAIRERLPGAELVARRDRERGDDPPAPDTLTDRQRTVLTTAYHFGFFDSPREHTGVEVAEELGISTPTFHEHIRIAERKLVEAYLGPGDDGERT
jgi:PAS domain S-box-containing protein